ncbi:DUF3574 domain-containing protein [uncultured Tenacibaculum sp.]|uniref:DUF3574 domain-containing protein n=1 Tax=uncultured Tenacibaculum sp. TaxID=174713 RepID=UPI00261A1029|nr:DUF3574 domain-containing protein [uncultured Tenacibaculum sp.]
MKNKIIVSFLFLITMFSCVGLKETSLIKTELYFGLSNKEGIISENSWQVFKRNHIDKIFNGYTIIDANGYWTDNNGSKITEPSKLLIYIHKKSDAENTKIDSIINLYKVKFNQESVLKVENKVKINF